MKKTSAIAVVASVTYFCLLTWVIMFKCNLLTSDMRFGYRSITLVPFGAIANFSYFCEYFLNIVVYVPMGIYACMFLKNK